MAGVAADALVHVNAVIEENEVGKLIHPRPVQGLTGAVAGADWFEQLSVSPDLRMAVNAGLGGRNAGEARGLDRGMAVTAVDAESGDMMLVAERDRLRLAHSGVGDVRRALDLHRDPTERGNHEDRAKNRGPGQSIRTAMKNLRHAYGQASESKMRPQRSTIHGSVIVTSKRHPDYFAASNENWKL